MKNQKNLQLNVFNVYKEFNGKKFQYNGTVPKKMRFDIIRLYKRHNLIIRVEPDEFDKNIIKVWSREK